MNVEREGESEKNDPGGEPDTDGVGGQIPKTKKATGASVVPFFPDAGRCGRSGR